MAKSVKLMLNESVDGLGIVGDVVNVRLGYARNFLLPRGLAVQPSEEAIAAVAQRRAEAERRLSEQREQRAAVIRKIDGLEITMQRACNDQGLLYASVTQQDIAAALGTLGYAVRPRDVRLNQNVKRIDAYDVLIKFDADLEGTIKLHVTADRELEQEQRAEVEVDDEGNLVEAPASEETRARKPRKPKAEAPAAE